MTDELKPCPAGHANPRICEEPLMTNQHGFGVTCRNKDCGWEVAPIYDDIETAAEVWNTRAESAEHKSTEGGWRDHVEQRLLTWRQWRMNESGDRLALEDFMGQESIDDLIDYVCDEWAFPYQAPGAESADSELYGDLKTTEDVLREFDGERVYQQAQEAMAEVERLRARVAELEAAQAWKSIDSAPADCDLLLYCPDRGPTNEARIELRQFKNTRAGSMHAWATHWMPLPKGPEGS